VHDGNLTHAQIADRLMIEPPTLTGILDRMEREGWIARQPAESDRRVRLISLRPEAEGLWNKVVHCLDQLRHHATRGMSAQEIETLRVLLTKVRSNLESVPSAAMEEPATIN
jgi:MarR family transcriptional regulator for hemolysin